MFIYLSLMMGIGVFISYSSIFSFIISKYASLNDSQFSIAIATEIALKPLG